MTMAFNFPDSPVEGQTYAPPGGPRYVYTGSAWRVAGSPSDIADTVISPVPPTPPFVGQLWFNSSTGSTYIWYEDVDSAQWVQTNVGPGGGGIETVRVEDFGARAVSEADLATLTGADALAAANDVAVQAALDYAASIGGGYVSATGQLYVMGTAGLEIPEGVFLRGDGNGAWDTIFHARPKTWRGTTFLFKGTGVKKKTIRGVTSSDTSGGERGGMKLASFMNANASGTTPATPRAFSAAICGKTPQGRDWGVIDCRIVPWNGSNGISEYDNRVGASLGDDWDVGILIEDGEYVELLGVQSVGYWRMFGAVFVNSDWATYGGQERNRIENCKFQGHTGLSIRAGDQHQVKAATTNTIEILWSAESPYAATGTFTGLPDSSFTIYTYTSLTRNGANLVFNGVTPDCSALTVVRAPFRASGAAGTYFLNTIATGLDHVSGVKAEALGLTASKALEISGYPLRGLQFFNFKVMSTETIREFFHNTFDTLFVQCQFEGAGYRIASPAPTASTAPAPIGDTRNLRFISTISSGQDDTYWTPRSLFDDIEQLMPDELTGTFSLTAQANQDIQALIRTGKSFYVRKPDGTGAVRVSAAGSTILESGGTLTFTGGAAIVNVDAGQALSFRHGTTARWTMFSSGNLAPAVDNTHSLGSSSGRIAATYSRIFAAGAGDTIWTSGIGSPEGVVAAAVGSLYTRTDGGASTTLYVKQGGGTGNTGWVAK